MSHFTSILEIMRTAPDFDTLKSRISPYINYLDRIEPGSASFTTIASMLVQDRNFERVEWLRELGASVTSIARALATIDEHSKVEFYRKEYNVNSSEIAYAYAWAGNHKKVEEYRKRYKASPSSIVRGYLDNSHYEKAREYKLKYFVNPKQILSNYSFLSSDAKTKSILDNNYHFQRVQARGLAMRGLETETLYITALWPKDDLDTICNDINIAHAFAEKEELIDKSNNPAFYYAIAGNHVKVNEHLEKDRANVDYACRGYAKVGHHKKIDELRSNYYIEPIKIAAYYIFAGDLGNAERYRKDYNLSCRELSSYCLAPIAEDPDLLRAFDIKALLNSYKKERDAIVDKAGKTKKYFFPFFTSFQKSLEQKTAAANALLDNLNGTQVDLSKHISCLRSGKLGTELRAFIKAGKADELFNQKVSTVRDFIKLVEKNVVKLQP